MASLERGQVFADRYEVLGTLGKGGMGVVYRARDRQLDEVVALKLLRPDALAQDPTILERFKQEIKLARRITHRNVLRTHDFGEAAGVPYISMEYVDGVTLKDLIHESGGLPVAVALDIAVQIVTGLTAIHDIGIMHRDVKPSNLMRTRAGLIKLMDFGIAKEIDGTTLTAAGHAVKGTPEYMSPEQVTGRKLDQRIRQALHGHLRAVAEQLDAATVFTREWRYLEGDFREEFVAERRRYEARWRELFREGVERGELRVDLRPSDAALLVLSAANWAYTWLPEGADTGALADRFTAIVVDGIGGYSTPRSANAP